MSATKSGSVMTTIEDDSAPLLPHELNALAVPPPLSTTQFPQRSQQLPPNQTVAAEGTPQPHTVVSPAVPVLFHSQPGPPSPLEPFPDFDPEVGPSEEPPYCHGSSARRVNGGSIKPAAYAHAPESPQHRQCRQKRSENHAADSNTDLRPSAPSTSTVSDTASLLSPDGDGGESHFLKLLIRCHTLFTLAERLLLPATTAGADKKALAYLHEAKTALAILDRQRERKLGECDCTPQQRWQQQRLVELSADNLRKRLEALEKGGVVLEKERRVEESDENEKTARVTAWLGEL